MGILVKVQKREPRGRQVVGSLSVVIGILSR